MALTTGGTTYVTSTDLVANYPTASLALANRVDVVASGSMSKKTASYTVTVADILAGTTIAMNSASATVITLPSTSLVNGMQLSVFSVNTGAVTFTGGTVTGTSTSITAQYSGLTLTYDSAAAVWWSLPFGGGSARATVTGTTGSPTITTVGGKTCYVFTGSGSITIGGSGGLLDMLMLGGGGGGANATLNNGNGRGGGGAGGYNSVTNIYLPAGTHTVTVGAGGTGSTRGGDTVLQGYVAVGGGLGGGDSIPATTGGSGGGGGTNNQSGAAGLSGQGFAGGTTTTNQAGSGGGGASAVGVSTSTTVGGAGGAGLASSITGSSVTRGGGGGGGGSTAGAGGAGGGGAGSNNNGTPVAGTVNTGGGGGGAGWGTMTGATGGSGVVILLVG